MQTDLDRCLAADLKANIWLRISTLSPKAQGDDFEITSIE
jgi:hypothetical protein